MSRLAQDESSVPGFPEPLELKTIKIVRVTTLEDELAKLIQSRYRLQLLTVFIALMIVFLAQAVTLYYWD